jgi:hypothetical protein
VVKHKIVHEATLRPISALTQEVVPAQFDFHFVV